jgi:SAM-dependent methyltransferase
MQIYPVYLNHHVPTLVNNKQKESLKKLIYNLSKAYPEKNKLFWKKINNDYFSDIIGRVFRMKSLKFIFLPPLSFYFGIGFMNFIKKFKFANFLSILKAPLSGIIRYKKKIVRSLLPMSLRKHFAIWINNQRWLSTRFYWAEGIIRDLMRSNPKAFHKFMWANHIQSYAKWYDSETLFDGKKMNGSTETFSEFFNDLFAVIKGLGLDPSRDMRSVLEVGCSLGYVLRSIEMDVFPNSEELVGIDIDSEAINKGIRYLSKIGSKARLIHGDMEELDRLVGYRNFDFTFAAGVLSYLNAVDATKVVSEMLCRTNKVLALVGLACTSVNNRELCESQPSMDHRNQWIHNFEAIVGAAGGHVVASRWEGNKQFEHQPIYFVFAVPKSSYSSHKPNR